MWKKDLLVRALDKGLLLTFAKWLRDFLSNRQAWVQITWVQTTPAGTAETGAAAGVSTIAAVFPTLYQRSEDMCSNLILPTREPVHSILFASFIFSIIGKVRSTNQIKSFSLVYEAVKTAINDQMG